MGNNDLVLVHAARLKRPEPPINPYWLERYLSAYDAPATARSYPGRTWNHDDEDDLRIGLLDDLRVAMPETHRRFLAELPWVAEASGHLYLHCGRSPELEADAIRIRIDTSGGYGPITACLLTSPTDPPRFISNWDGL